MFINHLRRKVSVDFQVSSREEGRGRQWGPRQAERQTPPQRAYIPEHHHLRSPVLWSVMAMGSSEGTAKGEQRAKSPEH